MSRFLPFYAGKSNLLDISFNELDEFDEAFKTFFKEKLPIMRKPEEYTFKLDIRENNQEYVVEAELPGVKREEIKVSLDEGRLTISIQREERMDDEKNDYIHKERRYKSTSRNVYLTNCKPDGVTAKLDNGILYITVLKEEKKITSYNVNIE